MLNSILPRIINSLVKPYDGSLQEAYKQSPARFFFDDYFNIPDQGFSYLAHPEQASPVGLALTENVHSSLKKDLLERAHDA